MTRSLIFLLVFTFYYAGVFAQNIQGSLRIGSSNQDIIITVKNNGASPYIGNLTSFDVTVRLYGERLVPKNMKYTFSNDIVVYNRYTNFTLPFYHFYWAGSHAINLAPGETLDLVGFQIWEPYPMPGTPGLLNSSVELIAGEYLDHPWSVKLDGVEIADQNNRFFDSGALNAIFFNDPFGSEYRILADVLLPVLLSQFNVSSVENAVTLNWTTTEEINSSKFEIQHSTDSKIWKSVGSIAAYGESSETQHYSFSHSTLSPGNNYYRLKMIDLDLTYSYSRIEVADMPFRANAIYPNPATSEFTLQNLDTRNISVVKIYNAFGKLVSQSNPVKELIYIDHFSPGTYIAVIHKLNGSSTSHKFVKK
jgi:hypothetical protein